MELAAPTSTAEASRVISGGPEFPVNRSTRNSRDYKPAVLTEGVPFFSVSTEMTSWSAAWAASTCALIEPGVAVGMAGVLLRLGITFLR